DFFKLLIFSSSPLGVRGKNGKNQQFEGFLYYTQLFTQNPRTKSYFRCMIAEKISGGGSKSLSNCTRKVAKDF
ncbi:MAG: hypothetical protein PWQ17_500, partial [Anaerophaga sp.]|nr:hypothetical protein [Anaerophaga sp.]